MTRREQLESLLARVEAAEGGGGDRELDADLAKFNKKLLPPITIEHCSCGHPSCKDYWLVGAGKFVQGSGFTKLEAERIAELLNTDQIFQYIVNFE